MRKYLDSDGDTWAEQSDGQFRVVESREGVNLGFTVSNLESLRANWGPLTEVAPAVTRAEFAEFLGELREAFDIEAGGPAQAHRVIARWFERMGGSA